MSSREKGSMRESLAAFGSIVANSYDENSTLPLIYILGFIYERLIPSLDCDKLGLMLNFARHSKYHTYIHDFVSGNKRCDKTIQEITYNLVLGYGLKLMLFLQLICTPNGSKDFSNVTVFGFKFNVTL